MSEAYAARGVFGAARTVGGGVVRGGAWTVTAPFRAARGLYRGLSAPLPEAPANPFGRGFLVGENAAPGLAGARAAAQEGAMLAQLEVATGLTTAEVRQALAVWEREGIEMLVAEGLTGAEIRALSQVSQAALRRLLPGFTARELADLVAVVGPQGLEAMSQVEAATLQHMLAGLPPQRVVQLVQTLPAQVLNRLAGQMTAAELDRAVTELGPALVARMGIADGLTGAELNHLADVVAQTRAMPNVQGLNEWLQFEAGQDAAHARNAIAELLEAQRLARGDPAAVVTIGDANPPMRNATDPMQSFDMTVQSPETGSVRSVEVTTARGAADGPAQGQVTRTAELSAGVQHAADKAATRIADAAPIPGDREAVIRVRFYRGDEVVGRGGRGGTITYNGAGGYSHQPPHAAARPRVGNILADFQGDLPIIRNSNLLERVRLVNDAGAVIAEFERQGGVWVRIR